MDNPPAFPIAVNLDHYHTEDGMTLLDYFAGQALVGFNFADPREWWQNEEIAKSCYDIAQAMLSERARRGGDDG